MKCILPICCLILLSLGSLAAEHDKTAHKPGVSIFEVAWQCPAAPAIGCGSHAKPVLLQLQANPAVSEAWLNRQGTMVAVVWNPETNKNPRREAEKLLKEQDASMLSGDKETKALADFNSGKGWYRGADVDRLSEEEAGVIAARLVRRLQAQTSLPKEKADGLQSALTDALKNVLTG